MKGPAVIAFTGNTVLRDCNLGGPTPEAVLWEVDPTERPFVCGVVVCKDCTFIACTFDNIGIAGPPEMLAQFRAA